MRLIAEARVKTGDFIARLMMGYAGFAVFCVFTLFSPDRGMTGATANVDMPLAGTVLFLAFMVVAPVVLIGMRIYLEVYVQRWRHLDAELDAETEPMTVSPLKHPLLRHFSAFVLEFVLPATLVLFTLKAAAKEDWGEAFLLLTLVCVATQVYGFNPVPKAVRAAHIAVVSGLPFIAVLYAGGLPHRGLELTRENLEAAHFVGEDLRGAVTSVRLTIE